MTLEYNSDHDVKNDASNDASNDALNEQTPLKTKPLKNKIKPH